MKIIVQSAQNPDKDIVISIPTGLICNRLGARIVLRKFVEPSTKGKISVNGKDGGSVEISPKLAGKLISEVNRFRKKHKDFVFIEADSANGDKVRITL